jgi:hypothetical protein
MPLQQWHWAAIAAEASLAADHEGLEQGRTAPAGFMGLDTAGVRFDDQSSSRFRA